MANLYGVANAPVQVGYVGTIGGVDIVCPASVETNFADTGLLVAPSQGWFFPWNVMVITLAMGATVPTSLQFGIRVNNGADVQTIGVNTALYVPNGVFLWTLPIFGSASQTLYAGTGSHVQFSLDPVSQPCTIRAAGTYVQTLLLRAPDQ